MDQLSIGSVAATDEIRMRHGNTLMGLMRDVYGPGFAPHLDDHHTLGNALNDVSASYLIEVYRDHHSGMLASKIENRKRPT